MSYGPDGSVTRVGLSVDTGSLVSCTGGVLGPMFDHAATLRVAREHRGLNPQAA